MVGLSPSEFERTIELLSDAMGFERLKDRFVKAGALTSKRGLGSVRALADRLYMLSGGLRREVRSTHAFQAMWNDNFTSRMDEAGEKQLEESADAINACLTDGKDIDATKTADLDAALAAYHGMVARVLGEEAARFDMLLKAVPAVAGRIRQWPDGCPPRQAQTPARGSNAGATSDFAGAGIVSTETDESRSD